MDVFDELTGKCGEGKVQVCVDSRKVGPGDVFVAMSGSKLAGIDFADDAVRRGASWLVCSARDAELLQQKYPQCRVTGVPDTAAALWQLASARWHTANLPMDVIGITGTNGKTTCAWLLDYLFSSLSKTTGVLGTISYRWPGQNRQANLTTPDALALHEMLHEMQEAGVNTVIMEVSSHALAQARVGGIEFSGAIFTNLTQDHLDYHQDMEEYFRAKARLFLDLPKTDKAMAINSDDRYGRRLLELRPDAGSYGLHKAMPGARHLEGEVLSLTPDGMRLKMSRSGESWILNSRLVGAFNALNLLAAQALALQMGATVADMVALENFGGVPGRLERISNPEGRHVFVDYAHTPDALVNALQTLRGAGFERIITVFGCGGNRDRSKRPLMGKAVAEYSDIAVLTSDNPRLEDPEAIMEDVKPGLGKAKKLVCEADRRAATQLALDLMKPGDALLIAGKGHEDYQILGTERRHYSDQEVVRELLGCA